MTFARNSLALASWLLLGSGPHSACGANPGATTTTVYVGRHFEVREDDQPVKYVLNGDTRVARITGSLKANPRLQRLRLQPGWNLCALAVGDFRLSPHPAVDRAYRWDPASNQYASVDPQLSLRAGTVLWIKANAPALLSVKGAPPTPGPSSIPAGGALVGSAGLEPAWLDLPEGVTLWKFDAASQRWRGALAGDLAGIRELPPKLAPGEAIYLHATEPVQWPVSDPAQQMVYYHQDHLGSSSVVTDGAGAVRREVSYHPFGAEHHQEQSGESETYYGFTQKEKDPESALLYFGQRYVHAGTGRWLSPDPLGEHGGGANPYAYVNHNPLKLLDPDGAEITVTEDVDRKSRTTRYTIHLKAALIDVSSTKFSQRDLADFRTRLVSRIEGSFSGSGKGVRRDEKTNKILARNWDYRWSTSVDLRVINDWKQVEKDDHVFRIVDRTRKGGRGESTLGGMLIDLKAAILSPKSCGPPAEETGAHEVGHTGRLEHDNRSPNLMMEGGLRPHDAHSIGLEQIQAIWRAAKSDQLNQRDPIMSDLDEIAKRR